MREATINFENQVCVVTGAGSPEGIGFATARLLGKLGGTIILIATTERIFQRVETLKKEGIRAVGYKADLMDRPQVKVLFEEIIKKYGTIHVLINNAGMAQVGKPEDFTEFNEMEDVEWDDSISRNLTLCYNVTRRVINPMVKKSYGRIVNVSSVTGPFVSNVGESAYSAAKAGMVGLSRGIAIEVGKYNITVNAVLPGWIKTGSQTESEAKAGENTPMGRCGTPEEVGHMIVFLASKQASYITGQTFVVDGGNIIQETKGS